MSRRGNRWKPDGADMGGYELNIVHKSAGALSAVAFFMSAEIFFLKLEEESDMMKECRGRTCCVGFWHT